MSCGNGRKCGLEWPNGPPRPDIEADFAPRTATHAAIEPTIRPRRLEHGQTGFVAALHAEIGHPRSHRGCPVDELAARAAAGQRRFALPCADRERAAEKLAKCIALACAGAIGADIVAESASSWATILPISESDPP